MQENNSIFTEELLKQRKEPMRFTKALLYHIDAPKIPIAFFDSSGGPFDTVPVDCWLELYDQYGNVGQAPCTPLMKTRLLPWIMTGETKTYEEWYRICYWENRNNGFSGESANEVGRLDLALHDLMAKRAGLPLHKLLGAERNWSKVYASGCGVNLTIEQMEAEVKEFINLGFDCFKMKCAGKFGANLDRDVERVRIVREMIGPDCKLAIDVNQIWKADQAMRFLERVLQYNPAWYEEPVHSHDFRELDKLSKICPVPIGMGESVKNYYMLEEYVHCGVGQLQPIPTNQCSVEDWLKGRKLAYDNNLEFTAGGISQLTASMVASGKEEDMVEYLYPIMNPLNAFMKKTPELKNGKFLLDDEPGFCLVPDFNAFDRAGILASVEYFNPTYGKKSVLFE